LGKDYFGDFLILNKDFIPNGGEGFEGDREVKRLSQGFEKFNGGNLPNLITIDLAILEIEEMREYSLRILELFFLREMREFLCDLIMVKREDHIAQIVENDFNRRSVHQDTH
jgi:hypothetical protein